MRTIRTTLLLSLPCGACVLNQNGTTTDIALDTGSETTQVSGAEASSGSSSDDSASDSSDASSASGPPDPADTGSETTDTPALCGNGVVDPGEECDGGVPDDDCSDHNVDYNGGELGCGPDCRLDTSHCERCEAPTIEPCDAGNDDPFNAIELDCDLKGQGWDRKNSVSLTRRDLPENYDPTSLRVFSSYGNSKTWAPRNGERALILSTGSLDPVDPTGALFMPPGAMKPGVNNKNLDFKGGLGDLANLYPITPAAGGGDGKTPFKNCDHEKDCSNTLASQWVDKAPIVDLMYIEFQTVVPAGTHGYELDLAFLTGHFPEHKQNANYNDVFMVWSQSELYVGNITYVRSSGGNLYPLSLPGLIDAGLLLYDGENASELLGTGFHGKDMTGGGATPWLTAAGPALPGESLTLAIVGFDAYDSFYDSAMIVDNFRWSCGGCELDTDCGLRMK